jgi:hypothetical protein
MTNNADTPNCIGGSSLPDLQPVVGINPFRTGLVVNGGWSGILPTMGDDGVMLFAY